MSFVKTDIQGQIMIIKLNRPERLNALRNAIMHHRDVWKNG